MIIEEIIKKLYHNQVVARIFHTQAHCLRENLKDCHSILDLGCGSDSPIKCCNVNYRVGVDAFKPYIVVSKKEGIHDEYVLAQLPNINFKQKSFDSVILIEVLEHLTKDKAMSLLEKAETWARKKVTVTMPNGYLLQHPIDQNPFQAHRSSWNVNELKKRGYKTYGMAGCKFLRKDRKIGKDTIFSTIRFRPRALWLILSELTQIVTFLTPKFAFEIFCVKILC